jgi:allantoin racemase
VIVLGCTATYGFYRELQAELGVPVIDSMIAAFKTAEFAAELRSRFGWSHSKIGGYESPPPEEFTPWRLEEQYDFGDMRTWLRG